MWLESCSCDDDCFTTRFREEEERLSAWSENVQSILSFTWLSLFFLLMKLFRLLVLLPLLLSWMLIPFALFIKLLNMLRLSALTKDSIANLSPAEDKNGWGNKTKLEKGVGNEDDKDWREAPECFALLLLLLELDNEAMELDLEELMEEEEASEVTVGKTIWWPCCCWWSIARCSCSWSCNSLFHRKEAPHFSHVRLLWLKWLDCIWDNMGSRQGNAYPQRQHLYKTYVWSLCVWTPSMTEIKAFSVLISIPLETAFAGKPKSVWERDSLEEEDDIPSEDAPPAPVLPTTSLTADADGIRRSQGSLVLSDTWLPPSLVFSYLTRFLSNRCFSSLNVGEAVDAEKCSAFLSITRPSSRWWGVSRHSSVLHLTRREDEERGRSGGEEVKERFLVLITVEVTSFEFGLDEDDVEDIEVAVLLPLPNPW